MKLMPKIVRNSGMRRFFVGTAASLFAIGCLSYVFQEQRTEAAERVEEPTADSDEPILPIERPRNLDARKVALGRKLFHDPRLSQDNSISCASCHILKAGGADHRARSIGIHGAVGLINAPTVLNSGLNFSQFWDGRAETLEAQVGEPIQSKIEMGSTWPEVVAKLNNSPEYKIAFREIYQNAIQSDHVRNAIAEFERSLATPNSRFDQYLRHVGVLTNQELDGYKLFKSFGCASCHQGTNIGGNMYQRVGVMAAYFTDRGDLGRADFGRFNVTGNPRDKFMFKVPSLRNVALTAPYFHDGSARTLTDAVAMMAKYQLGRPLSPSESELIVAFLNTLTGALEGTTL